MNRYRYFWISGLLILGLFASFSGGAQETNRATSKTTSSSIPGFPMPEPQSPDSKNYKSSIPGFPMPKPQSPDSKNYKSSIPGFPMPEPQSPDSKNYKSSIPGFPMPKPQSPDSKNYKSSIPGFPMPKPQSPDSKNYKSSIPGFPMPEPQIPGKENTRVADSKPSSPGASTDPKPKSFSQRYREFYSTPDYGQRYREAYNPSTYRQNYRNLGSSYFAGGGDSRKRLQAPGGGGLTDPYTPGLDDAFDSEYLETWGINGLNRHPLDSGGLFDKQHRPLNVPPPVNPDWPSGAYPSLPSLNPLLQPPALIPPHYIYPMDQNATALVEPDWDMDPDAARLPEGATQPETPRIIDTTAAIQPKPAGTASKELQSLPQTATPSDAKPSSPSPPAPQLKSPREWLYIQGIDAFTLRNYTRALRTWERLVTISPDYPAVHFAYGLSLFYQGEYHKASEALEHSIALAEQTQTPLPSLQSLRLNPYDFRFHHRRLARYLEENPEDVSAMTLFYILSRAAG
ncbi:MAG TPA: hypothetical protein PLX83_05215 [bacterium]|nr:hypothetical protein [bacterium]